MEVEKSKAVCASAKHVARLCFAKQRQHAASCLDSQRDRKGPRLESQTVLPRRVRGDAGEFLPRFRRTATANRPRLNWQYVPGRGRSCTSDAYCSRDLSGLKLNKRRHHRCDAARRVDITSCEFQAKTPTPIHRTPDLAMRFEQGNHHQPPEAVIMALQSSHLRTA